MYFNNLKNPNSPLSAGLTDVSECKACEPGQFCPNTGMDSPQGNCSARYYCSGNATTSTPTDGSTGNVCPVGHYCPEGTATPLPCGPGTFTDITLNEACTLCTPGYYCIHGSNPDSCPAGFYCPEGTGYVWESCPEGTFSSVAGLSGAVQCSQCTGGFYCDTKNLTVESGPCDPGYFCRSGSNDKHPSGNHTGDAGVCPEGWYTYNLFCYLVKIVNKTVDFVKWYNNPGSTVSKMEHSILSTL